MELKTAGDLMIPLDKYPHIPYWFTLRQAVAEIENAQIEVHGRQSLPRLLLIFDERYQLVGVLRRRDILRGLEPKFLHSELLEYRKKLFDVKADPDLAILSADKITKQIMKQAELPVSEMMVPIKTAVSKDDSLLKVVCEMEDSNLSVIPVLDQGKVAGVVRSVDILHEFAKILL